MCIHAEKERRVLANAKHNYKMTGSFKTRGRVGWGGRSSLHTSQRVHQAAAYPRFCSMKRLGVFLLPPGYDTSPTQGYPQV